MVIIQDLPSGQDVQYEWTFSHVTSTSRNAVSSRFIVHFICFVIWPCLEPCWATDCSSVCLLWQWFKWCLIWGSFVSQIYINLSQNLSNILEITLWCFRWSDVSKQREKREEENWSAGQSFGITDLCTKTLNWSCQLVCPTKHLAKVSYYRKFNIRSFSDNIFNCDHWVSLDISD